MTDLTYLDDVVVKLVRSNASDDTVVQAAQVSVTGENSADLTEERKRGLLKYLMKNRHGSPFEHNTFTFFVKAPIFEIREHERHRIGHSFNEQSGRYTQFLPEFYLPGKVRPLINKGTSANPDLQPGTDEQYRILVEQHKRSYEVSWSAYQIMIEAGIANEMARDVIPVGIFSSFYVTVNARSLMAFLSLRTREDNATNKGNPQWEIVRVAKLMEAEFATLMPITHEHFNTFGRVSP